MYVYVEESMWACVCVCYFVFFSLNCAVVFNLYSTFKFQLWKPFYTVLHGKKKAAHQLNKIQKVTASFWPGRKRKSWLVKGVLPPGIPGDACFSPCWSNISCPSEMQWMRSPAVSSKALPFFSHLPASATQTKPNQSLLPTLQGVLKRCWHMYYSWVIFVTVNERKSHRHAHTHMHALTRSHSHTHTHTFSRDDKMISHAARTGDSRRMHQIFIKFCTRKSLVHRWGASLSTVEPFLQDCH